MKAVGLIVEYNPFHNGHAYHLQQSKKISDREAVVAVMSGHFLQRGEPALLDKWTRTEMALRGGCDLVIELPVAYSTSSAEWFAYGAVALLEATGVVDSFCFGTESGLIDPLLTAATIAAHEPDGFRQDLEALLKLGCSYPDAYSTVLSKWYEMSKQSTIPAITAVAKQQELFRFDLPNHTLGLHYLIAKERLHAHLTPYTISREQAGYHDELKADQAIASATAIRKLLLQNHQSEFIQSYVPHSTYSILCSQLESGIQPLQWESFAGSLFHLLATSSIHSLASYREMEEGLQYRIKKSIGQLPHYSVQSLLEQLKTKRYTLTKLQRVLLNVLLQHHKIDFSRKAMQSGVQYIRVLGFTSRGQQLLKEMKKKAQLPIIHTPAAVDNNCKFLQLDTQATAVYNMIKWPQSPRASIQDYTQKPIMLSSS